MLELALQAGRRRGALRVLCLGAHSDDVEIGCGGTLLEWQRGAGALEVHWAVLSADATRQGESREAMRAFVAARSRGELLFGGFRDGRFPAQYEAVKEFVETVRREVRPDVVFCHCRDDLHQDHRIVAEMAWNTFRDQLVLEYEVPKWDGDLGRPNLYQPVSRRVAVRKAQTLLRVHRSQAGRDWFTEDTFLALMRLRGIEARAPGGHAEAFYARKLRLGSRV
jgi:LmbE family N-acetylglucosaminyl deacetylase